MEPLRSTDPAKIGQYVLICRLGAGGMGEVFLARSPGRRKVAIKVIRSIYADDPAFRARLRREVRAAHTVGGFWAASVVDFNLASSQAWFATEYIPGPSLAAVISEAGPSQYLRL